MTIQNVLIIGSNSLIAQKCSYLFAQQGCRLFLSARNAEMMESHRTQLLNNWAKSVELFPMDALEFDKHDVLIERAVNYFGGVIDVVLIAYGILPDQNLADKNRYSAMKDFSVNGNSILSLCHLIANLLEEQKQGCLAVVTSVAGLRGRKNNYYYAAAKAALNCMLSGLRNRLAYLPNIQILTIMPGLIETPMTAGIKKNILFAKPEKAAKDVYNAICNHKEILYTPRYWRLIMWIVRLIPEKIFKKMTI